MEDVIQQETLQNENRKKLSIFVKILEEKADIDETYATSLEKLSKSFTSLIDS